MKMRIKKGKPLNLNDQLNAINNGLLPSPMIGTPTRAMCKRSPKFAKGRMPNPAEYVQMFPTPRANSGKDACVYGNGGLDLQTAVKLWPTPKESDAEHGGPNQRDSRGNYALPGAVFHWQTPTVEDAGRTGSADGWMEYLDSGKTSQCRLRNQVQMRSTPTANDAKNSLTESQAGRGTLTAHLAETGEAVEGRLNADWVEVLMGYPQGWTDTEKEELIFVDLPVAWLDGSWEEDIPRIIKGQKNRVKRLKGLGNSVVPLIPMMIWLLIKKNLMEVV